MRTAFCVAILLLAVPAWGAESVPAAPLAPPAVSYDVWGFRWDGRQYAQQATYSLSTTNLKQAANYAAQITSTAGWSATTNMPAACVVHTTFRGPAISAAGPSAFPAQPTYSVWAFKLTDGKWVKDEAYSWITTDPLAGLEYAKKVNAVAGWSATDNCPQPVPKTERYVDGGTVQGAEVYQNFPFQTCDAAYGPSRQVRYYGRAMNPWIGLGGNWNALLNSALLNGARSRGAISDGYDSSDDNSSVYDNFSTYSDTSAVQNMISTQDMINNQTLLNNIQDNLNTQNFFNTENMINNLQDMVNTQNMVDTQNMINAMQSNP